MGAMSRWLSVAGLTLVASGSHAQLTSRADIQTTLAPQLSANAAVYLPNEEIFKVATERWSYYHPPNFTVVVEVAEEEDVAKTIKYANANDLPFLAVNGGHGSISSLSKIDHGIEIWMHKLNSVQIAEDGKTATVGGGIKSSELIPALFAHNKHTGVYGLASDQIVSLRIATANGEIIAVSENEGDKDLWWAVRGAGHNFGIVTSVTSKIYDAPEGGKWAYEQLLFTGNQSEPLFEAFNGLADIQPPGFMVWTYLVRIPEMNPEEPIYLANFMREAVDEIEPELINPFRELSQAPPLAKTVGLYTDIPTWINTAVNSRGCAAEANKVRFPISFPRYNPHAQKEMFDAFAKGTAGGSPFNTSMILLEQYSSQGVEAHPANASAYPHRFDDLLISPVIAYLSDTDEEEEAAVEFGDVLRDILQKASDNPNELHAYVNYASGEEGPQAWYGYEPWRLEKLKKVKRKYDPKERFSFYAPIPLS